MCLVQNVKNGPILMKLPLSEYHIIFEIGLTELEF